MPKTTDIKENIVDLILNILSTALGQKEFRTYFYGDPVAFQETLLPAIVVDEEGTDYNLGPTGYDEVVHHVIIQILFNKKDEFGRKNNEVALSRKLNNVMQGRDSQTNEFIANSILGILRKNITLNNSVIMQVGSVQFGIVTRPQDVVTAEAHLRLNITELQPVSNRS